MTQAYRLKRDREINGEVLGKKGDPVFRCGSYDYGCANDDTRLLGVLHISVTHEPDGSYPFFTVAMDDLEEIA